MDKISNKDTLNKDRFWPRTCNALFRLPHPRPGSGYKKNLICLLKQANGLLSRAYQVDFF